MERKELREEARKALITKYENTLKILNKHVGIWNKYLNRHSSIINNITRFQEFYDTKMFVLNYKIELYTEKLAALRHGG